MFYIQVITVKLIRHINKIISNEDDRISSGSGVAKSVGGGVNFVRTL